MFDLNIKKPLKLKPKIISSIVLLVILVILLLLKTSSKISKFISQNISRNWINIFGRISSFFDFSIFELIIAISIVFVLFSIIKIFVCLKGTNKLRSLNQLLILVIYVLSITVIYTTTASFAYNRDDLELDVYLGDLEAEELVEISRYFLQDFYNITTNSELLKRDENSNIICPYSYSELAEIIQDEFSKLDNSYFHSYTPKPNQ